MLTTVCLAVLAALSLIPPDNYRRDDEESPLMPVDWRMVGCFAGICFLAGIALFFGLNIVAACHGEDRTGAIIMGAVGVVVCLLVFVCYCAFVVSSRLSREEEAEEDDALEGDHACVLGDR
jgi:Na+/melibiose symporter-like transporter